MTTKVIGIKAFRQNMTKLWKKGRKENVRFIVMHHSVPVMEVKQIEDEEELTDELLLERFGKELKEALEQVKRGEVYSAEEVLKELNVRKKKR